MDQVFEREILLPPSVCDATGRLGYPGAFSLFMDAATEHAERLGIGLSEMLARRRFWLTVRTKIEFYERPRISEALRLLTWPEKPGAVRFNRSYELRRGEALLVAGRTEWAVLNTDTGTVAPSADLMPEGVAYERGAAVEAGYVRMPDRFAGLAPFAEYRVRSTDIDLGGHMNNAAYPRALFGALPGRAYQEEELRCIDLVFRAPCFEGETLQLYRREEAGALDLRMARGDETVLLARLAR